MRLSYILLVVAATLVATFDATSAASGTTLSQPRTANAVDPASAHETIGNDRRFLRKHKVVEDDDVYGTEDDEDEERGLSDWGKAAADMVATGKSLAWFALHYPGVKNLDDVVVAMRAIDEPSKFINIFDNAEVFIKKILPDFKLGMSPGDFNAMVTSSRSLTSDQQGVLVSAYSKYLVGLMSKVDLTRS
ncbi:hypothetical protein PRIC1_004321 [Phytophthora ramorum]|uniref:RxLR effector protein n=1 Tax=Phytophthora ramorum TaxID=164328 RepID=UPI0030A7B0A6|nr:RxLR effector protein [Phytophthora ramorum]KAH7507573.1 RxLR effector protein [Phytophthora ramorum]